VNKAVFLDRDGTIIREFHQGGRDLTNISQVKLYHNVPRALKLLQQSGYKLIVITNQSLIARGIIPERQLMLIHQYLKKLLSKKGIKIDAIYYCPHHPTKGIIKRYSRICSCRKPQTGLIKKAIKDFHIDPKQSFFIGDTLRDKQAAEKMGIKFVLILTGYGRKTMREIDKKMSVLTIGNLLKASKWIVSAL
jgi:D-glycero-D-manno-heptose 1,7-bisphosphate phosphatase